MGILELREKAPSDTMRFFDFGTAEASGILRRIFFAEGRNCSKDCSFFLKDGFWKRVFYGVVFADGDSLQ